jgi:hypothetical protein
LKQHEHRELAVTAAAFAEEAAPADGMITSTAVVQPVSQPVSENTASAGASPDPTTVQVQTMRIIAPNQDNAVTPATL